MDNVIVVASGKGGTGKSTVCICLSVALAKLNKKVLLLDCDCGMRGLDIMLDMEQEILFDAADAVCGNCQTSDAIYKSRHSDNLFLMSAPFDTENELSPDVFKQLVDSLKEDYDYILIDSPAGIGAGFVTATAPANRALIVANAEPTSVRGCLRVKDKLNALGITDTRLVINKFNRKQFKKLGFYKNLDEVIDNSGSQLIALVPYDLRLSVIMQRGVVELNWSVAATVFDCFARRLEGENVPLAFTG